MHEAVETFRLRAIRDGIPEGISKGNEGYPPRRAGVSGLASSQPSEVDAPLPWLVVILLINEMIQLGNLAAAQASALTFTSYLRPSEALRLCQDEVASSASGRATPRF